MAHPVFQADPSDPTVTIATAPSDDISLAARTTPTTALAGETNDGENDSPYPAFDATDYLHHNFTTHGHRNCTKALPEDNRNGHEAFNTTIVPCGEIPDVCKHKHHHHGKNQTHHLEDSGSEKNETSHPQSHRCGKSSEPRKNQTTDSHPHLEAPYDGTNGKVLESDAHTSGSRNAIESTAEYHASQDVKTDGGIEARSSNGDLSNQAIPRYVAALKAAVGQFQAGGQ